MESFTVHPIAPSLTVRVVRDMPCLPSELEDQIDEIWTAAAQRVEAGGAGRLFNGRVFSIDTIAQDLITGHMTEYRRLVAQVEDHTLFSTLGIRSLAACGVLSCEGGIVIGRRPEAAIYQPGMWQLCPAGSVDAGALRRDGTMDYQGQFLRELREELGLDARCIGPARPLCMIEHPGSHVCDLGMAAHAALSAEAVLAAHRAYGDGEYNPLRIVPISTLPAFIAWAGPTLVPPAPEFLRRAGFLDQGASPPTGP